MGRALLFAALSAAAMWTKQHAVFLGAMPVMYAVVSGRSRLLLRKPIWISIGVFSASALALLILSCILTVLAWTRRASRPNTFGGA